MDDTPAFVSIPRRSSLSTPAPLPIELASIETVAVTLRAGRSSAVELAERMLERAEGLGRELNAFVLLTPELALRQARRADEELARGVDRGALQGIPVAIKDLFDLAGTPTTAGTRHASSRRARRDATVVTRLAEAGAVVLGKTNLDELAFGTTSENPHYGPVRNPWRRDHHPGGSSGGSAAVVAAGIAYAALGTDTGCSLRQPAHCCGIVGLKPSFGRVSRAGVTPLAWSLDHVGPLARSVRDAALVLEAIAGPDARDPYAAERASTGFVTVQAAEGDDRPLAGTTVGVARRWFFEGGDPEVLAIVESALPVFEALGARLVELELPEVEAAFEAARLLYVEALAAHGEAWRADPAGFSEGMGRIFESLGRRAAAPYAAARHFQRGYGQRVDALMRERGVDLLAAPTSTVAAAPIGALPAAHGREHWKNTVIFDFTGQPSISLPCGFTGTGLPAGLMLSGRRFEDAELLRVAQAFEQASGWQRRHPPDLGL